MRRLRLALLLLPLALAACATTPPTGPFPPPVTEPAGPQPVPFSALPGWAAEDHLAAFRAYQATCLVARDPAAVRLCRVARGVELSDDASARSFFEANFDAVPVEADGLLTGYFAPEYEARAVPDEIFSAPVRPRPDDLVTGQPYLTRAEIERTAGPALAFMKPEDLFFLQIQGSGYLDFPDGSRRRAAYAADNGRPFTGIARPMAAQGLLPPGATSGDRIRAWLAEHRGPEAQAVTDLNARYIFFTLEPDDGGQPKGSAGVPLPAGRAAAVDPAYRSYGEPLWIVADAGTLDGPAKTYRRLVMALDTGGAIKGPARADLYVGRGEAAGTEAGRIKHPLKMYRLVPKR